MTRNKSPFKGLPRLKLMNHFGSPIMNDTMRLQAWSKQRTVSPNPSVSPHQVRTGSGLFLGSPNIQSFYLWGFPQMGFPQNAWFMIVFINAGCPLKFRRRGFCNDLRWNLEANNTTWAHGLVPPGIRLEGHHGTDSTVKLETFVHIWRLSPKKHDLSYVPSNNCKTS